MTDLKVAQVTEFGGAGASTSLPHHWSYTKVRYLAEYLNGYPFNPDDWGDDGLPIIRIQNLTNPSAPLNRFAGEIDRRLRITQGDVLISWSASLGVYVWDSIEDGWLNQHIYKAIPNRQIVDPDFFVWCGRWFMEELRARLHGSAMQHLTWNAFASFRVPLPPISEQGGIARLLARETEKIDTLIAKKERLIELLQEKRTALIARAVTRGLDPSVPMKDSRVEWLGEIPSTWKLERGRLLFVQLDLPPDAEDAVVTAFRDGQVTLRENRRTEGFTFAIQELGYQHVREGDLVVHGMDAFAGAIGVSESTGKCTPEYMVLAPRNTELNNHYYAHCLRLMASRNWIYVICPSVRERAPRFRYEQLKDEWLPVPPLADQERIVNFLKRELAQIGTLARKVSEGIERLKEYRTALISAAVTGKIDVRNEMVANGVQ